MTVVALFQAFTLAGCGNSTGASRSDPEVADSLISNVDMAVAEANPDEPEVDPFARYTYAERSGQQLFSQYCAVCHGIEGRGDGFNAYNLEPRPRDLADSTYMNFISDQALREVITQGGRGSNKSVLMPAYGHTLTSQEIEWLVAYIRALSTGRE
jgi:mono/diheme cytochrome c family protein